MGSYYTIDSWIYSSTRYIDILYIIITIIFNICIHYYYLRQLSRYFQPHLINKHLLAKETEVVSYIIDLLDKITNNNSNYQYHCNHHDYQHHQPHHQLYHDSRHIKSEHNSYSTTINHESQQLQQQPLRLCFIHSATFDRGEI